MRALLVLSLLLGAWQIPLPEKAAYLAVWTACPGPIGCADGYPDNCGCERHVKELADKPSLDTWLHDGTATAMRDIRIYQVAKQLHVETTSRLTP